MTPIETANRFVLHQFAFSHYNEKVRWALDWKGLAREDRMMLPGFHARSIRRLSGGPTTTPLLRDGSSAISGSARIVEHLDRVAPSPPLFPASPEARGEVDGWIVWLDEEVGPAVRLALFHELLAEPGYAGALFTTAQPRLRGALYRAVFPRLVPMLRSAMSIRDDTASQARALVDAAIARVAAATRQTGYLVGDRFSAADLTAGSLLFPLFFPPELPFALPAQRSHALESWLARWRGAPVEEYVRRLYGKHRRHGIGTADAPSRAETNARPLRRETS